MFLLGAWHTNLRHTWGRLSQSNQSDNGAPEGLLSQDLMSGRCSAPQARMGGIDALAGISGAPLDIAR